MTRSIEHLRREAKRLRRDHAAGRAEAIARVLQVFTDKPALNHADALHVIARESGFESWPKLKFAKESAAMDRAARALRLEEALYHGQHWATEALLAQDPSLADAHFGLQVALYRTDAVIRALSADPGLATRHINGRRPLLHLAFSRRHQASGQNNLASVPIADLLLRHGADPNDSYFYQGDETAPLSALYGALGHAHNLVLAEWLLDHGADPDDGESLYHSTELGHTDGLRLLLEHGAHPERTNALPRALDFNDHEAVRLLLAAGADPNEGVTPHPSGEPPFVIPALHQAARRMCDGEMLDLLLAAGADPSARYKGLTPYSIARVFGNAAAASRIAAAGGNTNLTNDETLLASAADDTVPPGAQVDPTGLNEEYRVLPRTLIHMPGKLPHIQRLIALGLEPDRPDAMGLPPVQAAGWEGLPDTLAYFLTLRPDLTHRNGYGGNLLSTILHGSENCPAAKDRNHIACVRLALEAGMMLPQAEVDFGYEPAMQNFLSDWADAHPDRVTRTMTG